MNIIADYLASITISEVFSDKITLALPKIVQFLIYRSLDLEKDLFEAAHRHLKKLCFKTKKTYQLIINIAVLI